MLRSNEFMGDATHSIQSSRAFVASASALLAGVVNGPSVEPLRSGAMGSGKCTDVLNVMPNTDASTRPATSHCVK